MATIKTQGGKVITKGGKVSCSCCEAGECCMYPAQALADGLYTYQDLPDSIEYLGTNLPVVLNKLDTPEFSNRFDGIAYFRGTYEFSGDTATVDLGLSEDIFVVGDSINDQARTNARCLIDLTRTLDQFADTYTVEYSILDPFGSETVFSGTTTITRESLCVWTGIAGTIPISLKYQNLQWEMISAQGPTTKEGLGFANTPTGYYFTDEQEFTVS